MASVNDRLASLEAKTEENGHTIRRVFEAIYGNGKPGLLVEFQLLRQSVEAHHESVEDLRKKNKSDWKWVITTGVAIAAVLTAVFK
jgi:hypothetical protein